MPRSPGNARLVGMSEAVQFIVFVELMTGPLIGGALLFGVAPWARNRGNPYAFLAPWIRALIVVLWMLWGLGSLMLFATLDLPTWTIAFMPPVALIPAIGVTLGILQAFPQPQPQHFGDPAGKVVALDGVVRLLNMVLVDAIHMSAHEVVIRFDGEHGQIIHATQDGQETNVTLGLLALGQERELYHGPMYIAQNIYRALVTRSRVMIGLDPADRSLPQEGMILIHLVGDASQTTHRQQFYVNIFPGRYGEPTIVFELLEPAPETDDVPPASPGDEDGAA